MDSQQDNPTNKDVAQTQSNIATDQPADTNQAGTSAGAPEGTTSAPDGIDKTVADDTTQEPKTDDGTVTRLKQQMAENNKLLKSLGIDPDSDEAERFAAGVMSKQELLEHIGIAPTPPATQAEAPEQKLSNILDKIKKEGTSEQDFIDAMQTMSEMVQEQKAQSSRDNFSNTINQCVEVVNDVIGQDELHKNLPTDLQETESQMFLSSTDNLVLREAQKSKNPRSFMNAGVYSFYAEKNAERLNSLRNHWIEYGRKLQRGDQTPRSSTNVNPISPSIGAGPTATPVPKVTRDNWRQAARNYDLNQGIV